MARLLRHGSETRSTGDPLSKEANLDRNPLFVESLKESIDIDLISSPKASHRFRLKKDSRDRV